MEQMNEETIKDNGLDMRQFKQNMNKILKENERLQHTKKIYSELAYRLNSLSEVMNSIMTDIKQIAGELDSDGPTNKQTHVIINNLYKMMQEGREVTRDLVKVLYPNYSNGRIGNIMELLKRRPSVKSKKEDGSLRLFI